MSLPTKKPCFGPLLLVASSIAAITGCRDLTFDDRRLSEDHVLAGRSPASGGRGISAAERAQGFFVSSDEGLTRFRDDLRAHIDLKLSLRGAARAFGLGNATTRDARSASPVRETRPVDLSAPVVPGIDVPSLMRNSETAPGELQSLCQHPLLGTPEEDCTSDFPIDSLELDDLHVDLDQANIDVQWAQPDVTLGDLPDVPVLRVVLPFGLQIDQTAVSEGLVAIDLQRLVTELRFQPEVCTTPECRTFGRTAFEGYTASAAGALARFSTAGVDVRVTSRTIAADFNVEPAAPCYIDLIVYLPICTGYAVDTDAKLDAAFQAVGTALAEMITPMLSPQKIDISVPGLPDWLVLDPSRIVFETDPVTFGTVTVPGSTRTIAAASGAFTSSTIDVLARGGRFSSMRLDLSSSPVPGLCAAGDIPASYCEALCAGAGTTCPMTNAKICFDFHDDSPPCDGGLSLAPATFRFLLALAGVSDADIDAAVASIDAATTPIPSMPNLAMILDAAPAFAITLQSLFTRPLDNAFGGGAVYSAIVWCPASGPRPAACPSGVNGPVFRFTPDEDRDGIPDGDDRCPGDPDPANTDTDGDGFCDGRDWCPFTPSERNNRLACECDVDGDGCNNELTGTPIPGAPSTVPRTCMVGPGGIFDERPSSTDHSTPLDEDGIINDCDPDDDGDGADDLVDNCPTIPNPDQADTNSDGHGDVCDPLCSGPGAPCPVPGDADDSFIFGLGDFDWGFASIPGCLSDGPGCGFFRLGCGSGGFCFDDVVLDFFQDGLPTSFGMIQGELRTAIAVPDLDADGFDDLVVGLADGAGGRVRAISGANGEPIWEQKSTAGAFGTAVTFVDGVIAVGAPDLSVKNAQSREGGIYFFSRNGASLGAPRLGAIGDRLGARFATVESTLYAGAPGIGGQSNGRVYVVDVSTASLRIALEGNGLQSPVGGGAMAGTQVFGKPALVITGPGKNGGGRVHVLERKPDGKLEGVLAMFEGASKDELGASISEAADFNGDGKLEVAIGAPGEKNGAGTLYLLAADGKLKPTGIVSTTKARTGERLVNLGDVTGDGLADLGVSFPGLWLQGAAAGGAQGVFSFAKPKK